MSSSKVDNETWSFEVVHKHWRHIELYDVNVHKGFKLDSGFFEILRTWREGKGAIMTPHISQIVEFLPSNLTDVKHKSRHVDGNFV